MAARNGARDSRGGPLTTDRPTAENPGEKFTAQRTPLEVVERACDTAWLHLAGAGMVSGRSDCLVTATLRQIMREAHALHEDTSPARRWWSS